MKRADKHEAMTAAPEPSDFRRILNELQNVLSEERQALVRLDGAAIEELAERKLELDAALRRSARSRQLDAGEIDALGRMRAAALGNQLLLVHARSCVKGIVALVAREQVPKHPGLDSGPPPPVALSFRG
jgi:hypothetical protein